MLWTTAIFMAQAGEFSQHHIESASKLSLFLGSSEKWQVLDNTLVKYFQIQTIWTPRKKISVQGSLLQVCNRRCKVSP